MGIRRHTAVTSAALLATVLAVTLAGCDPIPGGGVISTVGEVDFDTPLAIPPLAESTTDADGRRIFDLTAESGETAFRSGAATSTAGFNQSYLGPTLVAEAGDEVVVNVHNELDESTTVHWHGMHLPAAADGGPHSLIEAGDTASPSWIIDQNAATLWYHPHLDGETERQAASGLDGLFIVQDAAESALPLPRDYGVDDIPVIVQDVRFDESNQFSSDVQGYIGAIGNELLVNGTVGPYLEVTTDLVRLRLLNASTARSYDFGFADARMFSLIATDGGLLEAPVPTGHVQLSPGERAEILVAVEPGETAVLRSTPPDLGQDAVQAQKNAGADSFDVLELRASAVLRSVATVPETLVPMTALAPADAAVTRTFTLSDSTINGKRMDMKRVDAAVTLGTTEVWSVSNSMAQPHNFHVHGVQFQILTVDAEPPSPELAGWKDTIFVPPGGQIRIIMRFDDYSDPAAPYMFHCHLLTHEDDGMMGQFVVVRPGELPAVELESMDMNHGG